MVFLKACRARQCVLDLGKGRGDGDLLDDEFPLALVADLEEGFAGHVLHARVGLVHELKQLVHHRLQKLPVVAQEAGVLPHDVPAGPSNYGMIAMLLVRNVHCLSSQWASLRTCAAIQGTASAIHRSSIAMNKPLKLTLLSRNGFTADSTPRQ